MRISPLVKARFEQYEIWALTAFFSIGLLVFSWQGLGSMQQMRLFQLEGQFEQNGLRFGFFKHYFIPYILRYLFYFTAFMLLHFRIIPQMVTHGVKWYAILKIIVGFVLLLLVNIATDRYIKAYLYVTMPNSDQATAYLFEENFTYSLWLLFAAATYNLVKYGGLLFISRAGSGKGVLAQLDGRAAMWALLGILLGLNLAFFAPAAVALLWFSTIPCITGYLYLLQQRLIPAVLQRKNPKLTLALWAVLLAFAGWCIVALWVIAHTNNQYVGFSGAFFTALVMFFVATPAGWWWYHHQLQRQASMQVLEEKLGHSTAQLDQLRTQINPHFLFNALNTVYALALAENAEKTADSIDKISDMMRFMLRDNQEAFIPLHKDLNYVNNYVEIQRMRLGSHPAIDLQSNLPDHTDPTLTIAPMLFIPFVENAFKHGISLQAHTYIHLHIVAEGGKLTFSCSNSTHDRIWLNDPEQHNHGIGLQNVKERLKLLYPDRHLLSITENDHSYTVELTLLLHNSKV